jgi:hypothetical protein
MEKQMSSEAIQDPPPGGKDVINQTIKASDSSKVTDPDAELTQTNSLFVQENINNEESKNASPSSESIESNNDNPISDADDIEFESMLAMDST